MLHSASADDIAEYSVIDRFSPKHYDNSGSSCLGHRTRDRLLLALSDYLRVRSYGRKTR